MTKVFVTGIGIWCAIGRDASEVLRAVKMCSSGRRMFTRFPVKYPAYQATEAAVLSEEFRLRATIDQTLITDLALYVANQTIKDARVRLENMNPHRVGICLGTCHGGNLAYSRYLRGVLGLTDGEINPRLLLSTTPTVVGQVAKHFQLRGPTATISTACASGTNSIGRAAELVALGRADMMIAGGADIITELSFSGFNVLRALSPGPNRALDAKRDGMMLGEGAAMLLLESETSLQARNVNPYAEVGGYAIANDAFHPTAPQPSGKHMVKVMQGAIRSAGLQPQDIDYVNVHGTGTIANDEVELRAIKEVFGAYIESVSISSTKPMHGHALGAAGSIEAALTILCMREGIIPPTLHFRTPIQGLSNLRIIAEPVRRSFRAALSNSFGFAGSLASIVFKSPSA